MITGLEWKISKSLGEGLSSLPCPSNWFANLGRANSDRNDRSGAKTQQGLQGGSLSQMPKYQHCIRFLSCKMASQQMMQTGLGLPLGTPSLAASLEAHIEALLYRDLMGLCPLESLPSSNKCQ